MPAKSKAQLRFMGAVASGKVKKPGLSKKKASEFLHATSSTSRLPEKVKRKKR